MAKGRKAKVIDLAGMFPLLLAADPSFQLVWDSHREDGDEPLTYLVLYDLAEQLLAKLRDGDSGSLKSILDVVELWLIHGDADVCTATIVGLLETLQTPSFLRSTRGSAFTAHMGPELREAWDELDEYWGNTRWADRRKARER